MKKLVVLMFGVLVVLSLGLTGCSSDDDNGGGNPNAEVNQSLQEISTQNQEIVRTPAYSVMNSTPVNQADFIPTPTTGFVKAAAGDFRAALEAKYEMENIKDDGFDFYNLTGTWEWNSSNYTWEHVSDSPADEIHMLFEAVVYDYETNAQTTYDCKLRFYDYTESNGYATGYKEELYIDEVLEFWYYVSMDLNEDGTANSLSVEGGMNPFVYTVNTSGDYFRLELREGSTLLYAIEIQGEIYPETGEMQVSYIKFEFGELEFIMNDGFEPDYEPQAGDDIGDVVYKGDKIGDLVYYEVTDEEYGETYLTIGILFNNGEFLEIADMFSVIEE